MSDTENKATIDHPISVRITAQNEQLARNWWAVALRGIAGIIFGLIALLVPGAVMLSLALLFGAYVIVDGVFGIVAAVRAAPAHGRWGWLLAEGVLNLIMGGIALALPAAAILVFVLIVGAWAVVTGLLMLAAAFRAHISHGRGWLVFSGIISVVWGALLLISPVIGAIILTVWLGAYALLFGVSLLVLAFKLRRRHGELEPSPPASGGVTA